jgi:hypothetical protein
MRKKGEKKRRLCSPSGDPLDSNNGFTVGVESQPTCPVLRTMRSGSLQHSYFSHA